MKTNQTDNIILKISTSSYMIATIVVTAIIFNIIGSFTDHQTIKIISGALNALVIIEILVLLSRVTEKTQIAQEELSALLDLNKSLLNDTAFLKASNNCIAYPRESGQIVTEMENMIANNQISKIKVICYGTGGYGDFFDRILADDNSIESEIIICSPNASVITCEYDRNELQQCCKKLADIENASVYCSPIPPTIRASLVLDYNNAPLICLIQPYSMNNRSPLFSGREINPSFVGRANNPHVLSSLSSTFTREFDRLKQAATSNTIA